MLYLQGSGATATKLGECRTWSIDTDRDLSDDTAMGDTWKTQLSGMLAWSLSSDGNLDTVETSPFDAAVASATKKVYLYPDSTATARYYYGSIWPKLSVSADKDDTEQFTLTGDGDGQLAAN